MAKARRSAAVYWRLLVGGGALAVALGVVGLWWTFSGGQKPTADSQIGRQVAEAFLSQIRSGKIDEAWESTSAEFKSDKGRESFRRYLRSQAIARRPLSFVSYDVTELNELKRGVCVYEGKSSSGTRPFRVRIVIAEEANQWKVDGMIVE